MRKDERKAVTSTVENEKWKEALLSMVKLTGMITQEITLYVVTSKTVLFCASVHLTGDNTSSVCQDLLQYKSNQQVSLHKRKLLAVTFMSPFHRSKAVKSNNFPFPQILIDLSASLAFLCRNPVFHLLSLPLVRII